MSVLFLTESDVESLIDMPSSIEVVERAFAALADGSSAVSAHLCSRCARRTDL